MAEKKKFKIPGIKLPKFKFKMPKIKLPRAATDIAKGLWLRIISYDYKGLLRRIKTYDYKGLFRRIKTYDYKALMKRIKSFDYKNPAAYKKLFADEKIKRRVIYALAIILALSFFKSCVFRPRKKPIPPQPVQTALVIKKDAPIYIESFGTLSPISDVDIKSQVTGKVLKHHFTEGDEVKKGELLITIDPSEYKAALDKAKAQLAQDAAQLKLNKDTLERNKALLEKDLISKQDFETLQTDVAAARAKVKLDIASVLLAEINLGYCYIKSPIDGLTGKYLVDPGNIVPADTGPTLLNIKTVDPFYIDFTVSERELVRVRDAIAESEEKLKVEIMPEGDKDGPYEGRIIFVDNKVDDMTGTLGLRALVPNKERKLLSGEFVLIRLILSVEKDATLAPYEAVSVGQNGPYLFVITKKNKADLRLLTLGERQDDYIIVDEGVKPGEKVVIVGELGLAPGVAVKDVTEEKTEDAKQGKKK